MPKKKAVVDENDSRAMPVGGESGRLAAGGGTRTPSAALASLVANSFPLGCVQLAFAFFAGLLEMAVLFNIRENARAFARLGKTLDSPLESLVLSDSNSVHNGYACFLV
jgi:hypothetical protein